MAFGRIPTLTVKKKMIIFHLGSKGSFEEEKFWTGKEEEKMNGLIRWRPFSHLMHQRFWDWGREPEDLFESLMELQGSEREMWFPRVETYRKNGTFVVKADLPGVDAKNIHISVDRGLLTIRGERKMDRDVERKNFRGRGMFYGSFQRSLPIPEGLKLDKVKAKYHDGVLEITAPMEKSLPSKEIKIEVEKAA